MMWKWIEWSAKLLASGLLLSFLCVWTTGYIVNSYVESVLKQMDIPLDVQPFALSGVWGKLWGVDERPEGGGGTIAEPPASAPSDSPLPSDGGSGQASGDLGSFPWSTPSGDDAAGDDSAVSGQPEDGTDDGGALPAWNAGGAGAAAMLTDEQQQKLYSLVVSKLNAQQLQQLSAYLDDGLTAAELAEVQRMLRGAISDEEYAEMMELLQPQQSQEPATGTDGATDTDGAADASASPSPDPSPNPSPDPSPDPSTDTGIDPDTGNEAAPLADGPSSSLQ